MEATRRQMGRWVRVTVNGGERIINLDNVTDISRGPQGIARVWYMNDRHIDLQEGFEDFALRVMVSEGQIPMRPLSRDELAAIEHASTQPAPRARDLEPHEVCDPIYIGTEG